MKITDQAKIQAYQQKIEKKNLKGTNDKEVKKEAIKTPEDKVDIEMLKAEANKTHEHLRRIVEDLLERQGIEISKLNDLNPEDIKVDEKAREEAEKMIADDGPLGAEAVSTRIVEFAKVISGNDKSKLDILKEAIDQGFEEAKNFMGEELPEITSQTYDLIQDKLEAWENET